MNVVLIESLLAFQFMITIVYRVVDEFVRKQNALLL